MSDKLTLVERVNVLEGRIQQLEVEDDFIHFLLDENIKDIYLTLEKITRCIDQINGNLCFIETELESKFGINFDV